MKTLFGALTFIICLQLTGQQRNATNMQSFNPRFEVVKLPGDTYGNSVQEMVQDNTGFLWFATKR